VSLCINCSNAEEARDVYDNLASGGETTHPLQPTFWGALFGDLKDRYGNYWMISYDNK
jgi:PhnB protein